MASTIGTQGSGATVRQAAADRTDTSGTGWVLFAGTMIALIGIINFIYGIAAIDNSRFYVGDASYVFSDLNTWGWFLLAVGIVQVAAGVGIWAGSNLARWIGIASAGVNALIQMFILPAYPLWALAVFAIDVLILYGLIAHGRRSAFD
jgi:hypothetical protein